MPTEQEPHDAERADRPRRALRTGPDDRHMSDFESMMWTVDKDPMLSSTFGSVTLLDRPPDQERLRRRMQRTVASIPRLRQRVVPVLGRLAPPEWQDDPDFDIDRQVRRVALPAPGDVRALLDLATRIVQAPLDRTRPLWEFVAVEGLDGGRGALIQKMHHTITDGEGGVRMSEQFIDLTRAEPDQPVEADDPPPVGPAPASSIVESAADALGHGIRRGIGVLRRTAEEAGGLAAHPDRLPALGADAVDLARSTLRQVTVTDRSHSPLWTTRTLQRRLEVLSVPFDEAHRSAKALGGSLNDWFVTGAAAGAGAYHRRHQLPVAELRMAMPVSTRTDRSAGGNAFVPTRVLVPTGDAHPAERFAAVHDALSRTKHERALGLVGPLAGVVNLLPASVLIRVARQQVETVDFTTSNVRAAPFELYIAGGMIEATYALGPLGGTAFNLTMMSYRGSLDMGLHVDAGAIDEPAQLRACLEEAFAELLAATG